MVHSQTQFESESRIATLLRQHSMRDWIQQFCAHLAALEYGFTSIADEVDLEHEFNGGTVEYFACIADQFIHDFLIATRPMYGEGLPHPDTKVHEIANGIASTLDELSRGVGAIRDFERIASVGWFGRRARQNRIDEDEVERRLREFQDVVGEARDQITNAVFVLRECRDELDHDLERNADELEDLLRWK